MFQVRSLEYGHGRSGSYAVVAAQCGAFSLHPVAIDVCFDGVIDKVMGGIDCLLRHHVHVTLHCNGREVFQARCSRFAHDNVAGIVFKRLDVALGSPVQ